MSEKNQMLTGKRLVPSVQSSKLFKKIRSIPKCTTISIDIFRSQSDHVFFKHFSQIDVTRRMIMICDDIWENAACGGTKRPGSDQAPRFLRGV